MEEFEYLNILYKSAESLYKDCKYNASRMAIETLLNINDSNIYHNLFYFLVLIKIDGNLTGNDYINNLEKSKNQYDKILHLFNNSLTSENDDNKKVFFAMMSDYNLFKEKAREVRNRFNKY
jgi:hypothetical protein